MNRLYSWNRGEEEVINQSKLKEKNQIIIFDKIRHLEMEESKQGKTCVLCFDQIKYIGIG